MFPVSFRWSSFNLDVSRNFIFEVLLPSQKTWGIREFAQKLSGNVRVVSSF